MVTMSSDSYTIRRYEPDDRKAFLDLFEDALGGRMSTDWFAWKYEENPYVDHVPIVLAESDGRVVGARSFFGLQVSAGGRTYDALQPCDTMVRTDHRRRGLFGRMTNAALDRYATDVDLYFNFPNHRSLPANRKYGWRLVEERETFYRIRNPAAVSARAGRLSGVAARGYLALRRAISGGEGPSDVEWFEGVPPEPLATLAAGNEPRQFHVRRDERFYAWRFESPLWTYRTVVARRDGSAAAALVVGEKTRSDGTTVVQLADVLPLSGGEERDRLVASLVTATIDRYADADLIVAPGGAIPDSVLASRGFIGDGHFPLSLVSSASAFVARPATASAEELPERRWSLDGVRLDEPANWRLAFCEVDSR